MRESQTRSLVVDYYESFLSDRDLERYRDQILTRYTETTLARILATSVAVQRGGGPSWLWGSSAPSRKATPL